MTTPITTRAGKGKALTWAELDENLLGMRAELDSKNELFTAQIAALQAGQTFSAIGFTTLSVMNADLNHPANTIAIVTNDPAIDNNTYWIKIGASGAGSWQKADMPPSLPFEDLYALVGGFSARGADPMIRKIYAKPLSATSTISTYTFDKADKFNLIWNTSGNAWLGSSSALPSITIELPRMVIIGDSIAQGLTPTRLQVDGAYPTQTFDLNQVNLAGKPAMFMERLLGFPMINHGIGSTRLDQTITRWGRDVMANGTNPGDTIGATATLTRPADYIYLHCGINDVFYPRTAAQIKTDLATIIANAQGSAIPIIVDTIGPHSLLTGATDPKFLVIQEVNAWLKDTYGTTGSNGVLVADYQAFFGVSGSLWSPVADLHADSVHPSKNGFEKWCRYLFGLIVSNDFIKVPRGLILDHSVDLIKTPGSLGRATSVRITTVPAGGDVTYSLPNKARNVVPLPFGVSGNPSTAINIQILTAATPSELAPGAVTLTGFSGLAFTDAFINDGIPVPPKKMLATAYGVLSCLNNVWSMSTTTWPSSGISALVPGSQAVTVNLAAGVTGSLVKLTMMGTSLVAATARWGSGVAPFNTFTISFYDAAGTLLNPLSMGNIYVAIEVSDLIEVKA
jgi:hypothetical protein